MKQKNEETRTLAERIFAAQQVCLAGGGVWSVPVIELFLSLPEETQIVIVEEYGFILGMRLGDPEGFECELQSFGVLPEYRRRGYGQALLEEFISKCAGAECVFLEVRESNAAAISLYIKCGFQKAALRRKYYAESGEDAIILRKELK